MKKIITYSLALLIFAILFSSCKKERMPDNNSYWYSQERGEVVYSNHYCGVYVVATNYGYTIIQSLDGLTVYDRDLLYGDFGRYGSRQFYNHTANVVTRGTVKAFDLSFHEAQYEIDYYCGIYKQGTAAIRQISTVQKKSTRITNGAEK